MVLFELTWRKCERVSSHDTIGGVLKGWVRGSLREVVFYGCPKASFDETQARFEAGDLEGHYEDGVLSRKPCFPA